jgi:hypothetical protein
MAWRWPREPSEPSQRRTDGSQPDRWLVTSGIVSEVMSVIRKRSLLAKQYEQNAKDCIREAEGTDDPQWRKQLLNWAREWVEAAGREASRLRVNDPP